MADGSKGSPEGSDNDTSEGAGRGLQTLEIRRRTFLKYAGVSLAACSVGEALSGCDPKRGGLLATPMMTRVRVRRPEDLLVVDLQLVNLERTDDNQLVRREPSEEAYIILHFPRQHILEEVVPEQDFDSPPNPPLNSMISGESRVAFRVPVEFEALPYDLHSLLSAVSEYQLAVHDNASPRAGVPLPPESDAELPDPEPEPDQTPLSPGQLVIKRRTTINDRVLQAESPMLMPQLDLDFEAVEPKKPEAPGPNDTSIELPTRLLISPNRFGRFLHATDLVESPSGRVELWHSRLAALRENGQVDESAAALRTIRALWVRGQPIDPDDPNLDVSSADPDWDAPMSSLQRNKIVHQTSNWTLKGVESGKTEAAQPVDVDRLMLTALGGYLDSRGQWTEKTDNNLVGWTHRATLGRDHYVKIVEAGYLYPFGHRAAKVTISERKFASDPQTAYLFKRVFLVIKEPVRSYVPATMGNSVRRTLRQLPFTSVEVRSLVTPNLDLPGNGSDDPFVPSIDGKAYRFPVHMLDLSGQIVKADVAVVWVPGAPTETWGTHRNAAEDLYGGMEGGKPLSYTPCDGQRISLAPAAENPEDTSDNTSYEAKSVTFVSDQVPGNEMDATELGLPFLPRLEVAELAIEAARSFAGAEDALPLRYAQQYIDNGFGGSNAGELLFELAEGAGLAVDFASQSDKSGGFLAPSMNIGGISRRQGPVAGSLDMVAAGDFDPESFFAGALPKLFGVIPLTEILKLGEGLDAAPKFITDVMDEVQAFITDLSRMQKLLDGLKMEVAELQDDIEDVVDQVGAVLEALTNGSLVEGDIMPGGLLDNLMMSLTDLDQTVADLPAVPPGPRRFVREAIARVLEVLGVADKLLQAIQRFQEAKEMIKNRTVRLEFRPPIKGDPLKIFVPNRADGLVLAAEIRAKATGSKPAGADLICSLEDFAIQLIGDDYVFRIDFERLQFITRAGKKPDIDVVLDGMTFGGPLSFIERIKDIIPLDGFSDPPALDVGLDGIRATFSLPLPNVAVGIFALENMSISAGFHIPFLGDAISLNFGFCSRENPFSLTVAMLGGGGFVGLELTPGGVRLLEISLEFGASLAMDFAVASGGVEIKAGIYFALEGTDVTLTGYLRVRGHVQVLGIIGASIELAMELTYQSATGKVIGKASLKIEVTILCLTVGVTLECERKFAGSNGDPTFAEVFAPVEAPALPTDGANVAGTPWSNYVNSFVF